MEDEPPRFADEAFAAILIADPAMGGDARDAVAHAGGRLMTSIGWDRIAEEFGRQARQPVLVIEAEGIAHAVLEEALPRIDAIATALDLNIVVTLGEAEIDVVAATLFGRHVQLLCAPTVAERVAALAIAGQSAGGTMMHSRVREGEAERLRRLNEEVARIAEILVRLTGKEREASNPDDGVGDRHLRYAAPPLFGDNGPVDPQLIRRALRARRLRDGFFGESLFEDPAWDMLLDLYAADLEGSRVSVSSLCIAAAVAPTTALRWIAKLSDAGLFERRPDPYDRRRAFMALTEKAVAGMRGYVGAIQRAGLSIA